MLIDERKASNPVSRQVLDILDQGFYCLTDGTQVSIANFQTSAETGTRFYSAADIVNLLEQPAKRKYSCNIEVIAATTQVAGFKLVNSQPVILNFASARNPGGGFLGGAKAQEEELCRCSGLYRTLLTQPEYYLGNRNNRSLLYNDDVIYSPQVPFFRVSEKSAMLDQPFLLSVITAPAPNAGAIQQNQEHLLTEIRATFLRRWLNILAVAEDAGHQTLILGAWGCGAFRNDPFMVAETAAQAIKSPRFSGAFTHIVFAIPETSQQSKANLTAFRHIFV